MDVKNLVPLAPNLNIEPFGPGDTVRASYRVVEGNRERIQVFEGVVLRVRAGGPAANFTVRRIARGVGVERTFLLHSPRLERVEVVRHGKVRRANLSYLRGRTGKAARIKEKHRVRSKQARVTSEEPVEAPETQETQA